MARLNEGGQWIILMGFIVCVALFFFAIIVNETTLIGKTTSESVLEFPKADIQDVRYHLYDLNIRLPDPSDFTKREQMVDKWTVLMSKRKDIIFHDSTSSVLPGYQFHYNNGVLNYEETFYRP